MTQTSTLDGVAITNLDATPVVPVTTGEGVAAVLRSTNDFVTALSADSTSSVYKLVRIPTYAKVKSVKLWSAVASAGAGDFNVCFSDSAVDGTPPGYQGTIPQISSANNKLFGAAQSIVSTLAAGPVDMTFKGSYTLANKNQPLWQVLGYTVDPGGFFDIQINVTTQITTGGAVGLEVVFSN